MALGEILDHIEPDCKDLDEWDQSGVGYGGGQSDSEDSSIMSVIEVTVLPPSPARTTRSGRITKKPRYV